MSVKSYLSFTKRERTGILALVVILLVVSVLPHFIPKRDPLVESIPADQFQKRSFYRDSSGSDDHGGFQDYRDGNRPSYRRYGDGSGTYYNSSYNKAPNGDSTGGRPSSGYNYYNSAYGEGRSYPRNGEYNGRGYRQAGFYSHNGQFNAKNSGEGRYYPYNGKYSDRRAYPSNGWYNKETYGQGKSYLQNKNNYNGGGHYTQNDWHNKTRSGAFLPPGEERRKDNFEQGKTYLPGDQQSPFKRFTTQDAAYHRQRYTPASIEINTADTTAFIALPGIGSKLAARIVSFRAKLGGFANVGQIKEVYGLRDSVFTMLVPYLKCDSAFVCQLH